MARGLNKAMLIGRLGRDPEIRYTQAGAAVANFTIATNEEWMDKATGEKKEKTEWHRIVAFGKLGEICGNYLSKGRQVYIEGRIQTRSWEQDGLTKYMTEIVANDMQMLDPKGASNEGYQQPAGPQSPSPYDAPKPAESDDSGPASPEGGFDDDIPF